MASSSDLRPDPNKGYLLDGWLDPKQPPNPWKKKIGVQVDKSTVNYWQGIYDHYIFVEGITKDQLKFMFNKFTLPNTPTDKSRLTGRPSAKINEAIKSIFLESFQKNKDIDLIYRSLSSLDIPLDTYLTNQETYINLNFKFINRKLQPDQDGRAYQVIVLNIHIGENDGRGPTSTSDLGRIEGIENVCKSVLEECCSTFEKFLEHLVTDAPKATLDQITRFSFRGDKKRKRFSVVIPESTNMI